MKTLLKSIGLLNLLLYSTIVTSQEPFIMVVKTDNPGSCETCFHIPIDTTGQLNYNYSVDWENDGSYDDIAVTDRISHEYDVPGTYEIAITGEFPSIRFGRDTMVTRKIIDVKQWGDIRWERLVSAFQDCKELNISAPDAPDLKAVSNLLDIFNGCQSLEADLNHWDVSNVEGMSNLFFGCKLFNGNISDWDVSRVNRLQNTFAYCESFSGDLSKWDVSNVDNFTFTFQNTLYNENISDWDVSSAESMSWMFYKNETFNQDISSWDVSNVENFGHMFQDAVAFNQDLSNWDVSTAKDMGSMFERAVSFTSDLSRWDVSKVEHFGSLFDSAISFESDLSDWDVSNATLLRRMFNGAVLFQSDLSRWEVGKSRLFDRMFARTEFFNSDLSNWDTSTSSSMENMFLNAQSFDSDIGSWDISKNTNLEGMLDACGMSIENYETTLLGWAQNSSSPDSLSLGSRALQYCDDTGRELLLSKGWRISGDSKAEDIQCQPSVVSELASDDISIYPNPINDRLYILNNTGQSKTAIIYSSLGQLINTVSMITGENMLDTSLLEQGNYFILLDNGEVLMFNKL